ncbi:MAG: LPS export ABC transporter periplasmic protein LptC [Bacteroidia bacterium]|nr:LPS export ABC transporter periplasmic protein LptC [Bacteroidia bacterium]
MCAQETVKVELMHADRLEGDEILGPDIRKLIGNVGFKHVDTRMFCDSAYLNSADNSLRAFGNVRINSEDGVRVNAKRLDYDGNERTAKLFEDINMTDGKMTLTTDYLVYNLQDEVAYYTNDAKIVDGQNTLTSKKGTYYTPSQSFVFSNNVKLDNPRYELLSDTLKYNTVTETATFFGPSEIISKQKVGDVVYCNEGWYNTQTEESYFGVNTRIITSGQELHADSLYYNKKTGIGRAFKNVELKDTTEGISVTGNWAYYDEINQKAKVSENALLVQSFDNDSLYLHADTLLSVTDSATGVRDYYAYYSVKLFKSDMQGVCDSLAYVSSDSVIIFHGDPILWSTTNQLTADSMKLHLRDSKLDALDMYGSSFIISQEDSIRFNQIKGRTMNGFFKDSKLYKVDVDGNGQTIYYARNSKDELIGVNRADCSSLTIFVKDNEVEKLLMYTQPESTFYPILELPPSQLKLKDFKWLYHLKPETVEELLE